MTPHAAFWDRIAPKYARQPISNPDMYEAGLAHTRRHLTPQMTALEIGCGTGATALKLAGDVARIHGTDVSPGMIAQAEARLQGAPANVSFSVAEAHEAGLGRSPDVVLAFNLLHLVEDLPGLLRHIAASLPAGGLFISKTPCLAGKPWFRPLVWAMQKLGKAPSPVTFLSPARLHAALQEAGFSIEETAGYPAGMGHLIVARKA